MGHIDDKTGDYVITAKDLKDAFDDGRRDSHQQYLNKCSGIAGLVTKSGIWPRINQEIPDAHICEILHINIPKGYKLNEYHRVA